MDLVTTNTKHVAHFFFPSLSVYEIKKKKGVKEKNLFPLEGNVEHKIIELAVIC